MKAFAPPKGLPWHTVRTLGAASAIAALLSACGANESVPVAFQSRSFRDAPTSSSPIQHVVFIIQENRSFNNLFVGYPGARTQNYGYDTYGNKIVLHAQDLAEGWDLQHFSQAFFKDCDGSGKLPGTHCKMDGWNTVPAGIGAPKNPSYAYVPRSEIKPYWQIARQYVLADHMYASNLDGSFISHQYAVAAFASAGVDNPTTDWGCEGTSHDTLPTLTQQRTYGPTITPCFSNPTIADEADKAGITWHFYTGSIYGDGGLWSSYQADQNIYDGPDWNADVINPPSQFLTDIKNGQLSAITWITPTYENSDHPGLNSSTGPAWVASLVDAVGKSPFWKSTAIFIMWDDWGGWFDPVKPAFKDYDGLGCRVPLLMVSPYAKQNYVSHKEYETASVLRFIEDTFNLTPLAQADARATDPAGDAFDFNQTPRKFKTIAGSKPLQYWADRERASHFSKKPPSFLGDD